MAKQLPVYNDVNWDDKIWDVTAYQKNMLHKKRSFYLKFTRREENKKNKESMEALPSWFADFCKCFVKVKSSERNVSFGPLQRCLDAARILYEILCDSGVSKDLSLIARRHFAISEEFIVKNYSKSSVYRMSLALSELAKFIDRYQLSKVRIGYKPKVKRPRSGDSRGAGGQAAGLDKIPSLDVFDALAEISASPNDNNELIRIRIVDLLVVGGFRIGEVLTLPVNCWVEKKQYNDDGTQRIDVESGAPLVSYGLRYWPEKGADPSIKWIPSHTVPLARRAIKDLKEYCCEARARAKILEATPDRIPIVTLGDNVKEVTAREIGDLVGGRGGGDFVMQLGISPVRFDKARGGAAIYMIAEVERALLKRRGDLLVRRGVAGKIQMLSDSLCVCFYNQFKSSTTPFLLISELINEQHISDFLGGKSDRVSAFSRRGFKDDAGKPLRVNTHAFRHWLNSIADHGGLNELQLARWMGRKDIRHNEAYKHGTVAHRVQWAKEMIAKGGLAGPVAEVYEGLDPVDRELFLEAHVSSVHFTHFGLCLQDYAVEPCEYHLQCLQGCLHYLRTKGNVRERMNLKRLEEVLVLQIDRLSHSIDGEEGQGSPFRDHAVRQLNGVRHALSVDNEIEIDHSENEYVRVFNVE